MARVSFSALTKRYGALEALRGVSAEVGEGELFGVIGPDGAGKTTLLRILASLLRPTSGSARVGGIDPVTGYKQLRRAIGYMPGRFSLYPDLTVEENLRFFATLYGASFEAGRAAVDDIYSRLAPFSHRAAGKLSGGMKQKLALCCALVHSPRTLFLDEPTTGVDAVSRDEFYTLLSAIRARGVTIVLSTPYMDEAARCDRLALMHEGRFLACDSPARVAAHFPFPLYAVRSAQMHRLCTDVRGCAAVQSAYSFGSSVHVALAAAADSPALTAYLSSCGHSDVALQPISPSVEDAFIYLCSSLPPSETR